MMISLKGKKVILSKVKKNDLKFFQLWRNTYDIWKNNTQFIFLNNIYQKHWFSSLSSKDKVMFTIANQRKKPIGVCGFTNFNSENKHAKIAIIIGDTKLHSKGIGSETMSLLLRYGFEELKLHRIEAEIIEFNKISINFFKKFGFKFESSLRDSMWRKNSWWNIQKYSLINEN